MLEQSEVKKTGVALSTLYSLAHVMCIFTCLLLT